MCFGTTFMEYLYDVSEYKNWLAVWLPTVQEALESAFHQHVIYLT